MTRQERRSEFKSILKPNPVIQIGTVINSGNGRSRVKIDGRSRLVSGVGTPGEPVAVFGGDDLTLASQEPSTYIRSDESRKYRRGITLKYCPYIGIRGDRVALHTTKTFPGYSHVGVKPRQSLGTVTTGVIGVGGN